MRKHFFPIICVFGFKVVIGTLLYSHFEKGGITSDGWLNLLLMIGVNLTNINYWKEYFSKD